MSSTIMAAQRRRTCLLASSFLVPALSFHISAAGAQQSHHRSAAADRSHPARDANRTRAKPITMRVGFAPCARVPNRPPAPHQQPNVASATQRSDGRPGNLTASSAHPRPSSLPQDIARSPAQTVQEIIAQTPGVQLTSLFGGVNGVRTTVDLRGFGAFATANTLVLINGRRLNDIDMAESGFLDHSARFDRAN